jgi:hypothetical protein
VKLAKKIIFVQQRLRNNAKISLPQLWALWDYIQNVCRKGARNGDTPSRIDGGTAADLAHRRGVSPGVDILQEKRPPAFWVRPAPIPLLALPCRAMAHNIRAWTVRAV